LQQRLRQPCIERNIVFRVFRLYIVYPATNYAALHQHGAILKIEIAPLQAEYLADPKPQALRDQNHRAVWLAQMLEQFKELIHGENPWPLQTLACIIRPHRSAHLKTRCMTPRT
jgi:hypothetical protein